MVRLCRQRLLIELARGAELALPQVNRPQAPLRFRAIVAEHRRVEIGFFRPGQFTPHQQHLADADLRTVMGGVQSLRPAKNLQRLRIARLLVVNPAELVVRLGVGWIFCDLALVALQPLAQALFFGGSAPDQQTDGDPVSCAYVPLANHR